MRPLSALATVVAASVMLAVGALSARALHSYKWKYRPLLVFAPSPTHEGIRRQREIVAAFRPAFIDRHVVVIYVYGSEMAADLGPAPVASGEALRNLFGVQSGEFRIVLVGKDGKAKRSSASPIPARDLFRTIDAMPMRAEEVLRRR